MFSFSFQAKYAKIYVLTNRKLTSQYDEIRAYDYPIPCFGTIEEVRKHGATSVGIMSPF